MEKVKRIKHNCHDCGAKEGEIHQEGCDMERCPKCLGQLISCDCEDKDIEGMKRIPYICIPNICRLCGEQWPKMFSVSDKSWKKYVIPPLQNKMLCLDCYKKIKVAMTKNYYEKILAKKGNKTIKERLD